MTPCTEFRSFAERLLQPRQPLEIEVRRAVSALYYGLFHRLTTAGAMISTAGGQALVAQVARAYSHGDMRKICERCVRTPDRPCQPALGELSRDASDGRLVIVADGLLKLQEARHSADHDLAMTVTRQAGVENLDIARAAHAAFDAVEHLPGTTVFRTALLFADRWTRRG